MELKCKDTEVVDAEANRMREGRKRMRICMRDRVFAREFGSGQKSRVSTSLPVTPSTMKFEILTPHVIFTSNLC